MSSQDERDQVQALLDEAGQPSTSYETGFVNALLVAQGIMTNADEVYQHDAPATADVEGEGTIQFAIDAIRNNKKVRRASWHEDKYLQMHKGVLCLFCPVRGRERFEGFNFEEITATDWMS